MQRDKDTLLEQYEVLTLGAFLEDLTTERVQSTNPFGLGLPEATLWVNRPGSTPAALNSSWPFASFVSEPPATGSHRDARRQRVPQEIQGIFLFVRSRPQWIGQARPAWDQLRYPARPLG